MRKASASTLIGKRQTPIRWALGRDGLALLGHRTEVVEQVLGRTSVVLIDFDLGEIFVDDGVFVVPLIGLLDDVHDVPNLATLALGDVLERQ